MLNVLDISPDHRLLTHLSTTMRTVFPTVYWHRRGDGNHWLLAFTSSASRDVLLARGRQAAPDDDLRDRFVRFMHGTDEAPHRGADQVLTDDWAPVEALTRQMLITSPRR